MPIVELSHGELNSQEIMRFSGGGDPVRNPEIRKALEWAVNSAETLIDGLGIYNLFPAINEDDHIAISYNDGEIIRFPYPGTSQITGVEAAALFVSTIGNRLENKVEQQFNQGNHLEGLFLDSVGSTAAEGVATHLALHVEKDAKENNWIASYRFSPGYCTWDMEYQRDIFRLLPVGDIGVELTESLLMLPRKSISGVMFLGSKLAPLNPCKTCTRADCNDRRL